MSKINILNQFGLKPKYASEEEKLEAVKQNGYNIQYIRNPSEAAQLEAIKTLTFDYVDLITSEKVLLKFCKRIVVEQVLNV